jgi:hypothetical protein
VGSAPWCHPSSSHPPAAGVAHLVDQHLVDALPDRHLVLQRPLGVPGLGWHLEGGDLWFGGTEPSTSTGVRQPAR